MLWFRYAAAVLLNLAQMLQAEGVLLPSKHKSRSAQAAPIKDAPMAVVGADNSGHVVMLKAHSRKRQAEGSNGSDEAALDTQQAEGQQAVAEGREQQGQDAELTLEQRVNALQLHQTPGATLSCTMLANAVLCSIVAALYACCQCGDQIVYGALFLFCPATGLSLPGSTASVFQ